MHFACNDSLSVNDELAKIRALQKTLNESLLQFDAFAKGLSPYFLITFSRLIICVEIFTKRSSKQPIPSGNIEFGNVLLSPQTIVARKVRGFYYVKSNEYASII